MVNRVSTWMGDCLRAGKSPRYKARQANRLSFLPSWDGKMILAVVMAIAKQEI